MAIAAFFALYAHLMGGTDAFFHLLAHLRLRWSTDGSNESPPVVVIPVPLPVPTVSEPPKPTATPVAPPPHRTVKAPPPATAEPEIADSNPRAGSQEVDCARQFVEREPRSYDPPCRAKLRRIDGKLADRQKTVTKTPAPDRSNAATYAHNK